MTEIRDGVSAEWLHLFLGDAPEGAIVRGYEGEFCGLVVEVPPEGPTYEGGVIELAYIHNDRRVEITGPGKKWFAPEKDWEI